MRVKLFRYAKDELTRRKEERNVLSFDDLLLKLHLALEKKGGELVIPPEGFYVGDTEGPLLEGELERAADWAKQIIATQ